MPEPNLHLRQQALTFCSILPNVTLLLNVAAPVFKFLIFGTAPKSQSFFSSAAQHLFQPPTFCIFNAASF
jgi:hypothetical protein